MSETLTQQSPIRYRWVMLALAWATYFCFGLVSFSLAPLATPIMAELKLTYTQFGIAAGAWPLIYIASSYPVGIIIDRLGLKKSLSVGILVVALSAIMRSYAIDFTSLFASVAVFGVGAPIISIGLPKLIASWFFGRERGTASGIYFTGVSMGTAFSLGATNIFILPLLGSWRNVLLFYGIIPIIIVLLWIKFAKSSTGLDIETTVFKENIWKSIFGLLRYRNIWSIVLIGTTSFMVIHSLNNWLPKILETQNLTPTLAGILAASFSIFRIFGSLGIPRMSYILGSRKTAVTIILSITAVSIVILPLGNEYLALLCIASIGLFIGALSPLLLTILMDAREVGVKKMGAVGGLYFSFGEVGGVLGPVIIGLFKDLTGNFSTGLTILAIIVGAMLIPSRFLKEDS
ncbi:MAG: MFS transporter [Candidatus Bathyarchaeia archaeon]|nr:MFS transporter [Candidatus Bathyarchaeota archaeon]